MNLNVSGKWKDVKEKAEPMLKMMKEHPLKAAGGAALLVGLFSFVRMSSSISGLCDTIREGKKK